MGMVAVVGVCVCLGGGALAIVVMPVRSGSALTKTPLCFLAACCVSISAAEMRVADIP